MLLNQRTYIVVALIKVLAVVRIAQSGKQGQIVDDVVIAVRERRIGVGLQGARQNHGQRKVTDGHRDVLTQIFIEKIGADDVYEWLAWIGRINGFQESLGGALRIAGVG